MRKGVFPIKHFFSTALDNSETSNAVIKDYLLELIKNEDKKEPLSDAKILELIEEKIPFENGKKNDHQIPPTAQHRFFKRKEKALFDARLKITNQMISLSLSVNDQIKILLSIF